MKTCKVCELTKDISLFQKNGSKTCKTCLNIISKKIRSERPDLRQQARDRAKRFREANREYVRNANKEYRQRPERILAERERTKRRKNQDPHVAARDLLHRFIREGKIPRASLLICVDCGNKAQEYDHYLGYDGENALKVQPVCKECHIFRTKKERYAR